MTTFDSTKASLNDLLKETREGKIQLPDFQRGWVWDDDHVRDLLVSIGRSFPIGAVMLLESGGDFRFQTRPVEGLEGVIPPGTEPEKLILDGQQRLTTLTQTLAMDGPVNTRTPKGKKIKRHYYFDIRKAVEEPHALDEAVIAVDENRQQRGNFGRDVVLDLSSQELECEQLYFPCSQVMGSDDWEAKLFEVSPDNFKLYMQFRSEVLAPFRSYQIPVIELKKETTKEAVCLVFEKVNTGGVPLSVFELITASYAAEGYNLRDDWFGSRLRKVESRKERVEADPLLKGTEATEFLQAITLLTTYENRQADMAAGNTGKQVRPVSAKRADVLQLPISAWRRWADDLERGFKQVGRFLRKECFYSRREVPYSTQLIPLAALMARLGDQWLEPRIYDKIARWYWSGILGELYGGAVETRIALDFEQLIRWFEDDASVPRTVQDANFQPERFDTLRNRLSAAYRGINVLVLREGAKDWFWKASIQELDANEMALDIHHIFPRDWCERQGISRDRYDSILNKTPISYKTNRKIGGDAPSVYIERLQREKNVALESAQMDELLESHALNAASLRADDFDSFLRHRRAELSRLVERAMGKPVSLADEPGVYETDDEERTHD